MIEMKSRSDFHNTRVVRPDGTHTVKPGDGFATDFLHAKDLVASGLAEAVDPDALAREPTEPVPPHPSISAPSLKAMNANRSRRAIETENAALREATGQLETLRGAHETLAGEHRRLLAERERLESDHDTLKGEHDAVRARAAGLEEEVAALKRDNAALAKKAG